MRKTHKSDLTINFFKVSSSKISDCGPSAASHLQNVIPTLLIEDVVLKVFSVHILGFLDLLRSDDFA